MSESLSPERRFFHEQFMREALILARRGAGNVHPNPLVGAAIVANGTIVGRGWHKRCGEPHAEVNAVADARRNGVSDFSDATLYVTLEPCCHTGRTPPCCGLVIAEGIRTVVAGLRDPDPRVSGKGFQALRAAGIDVIEPVLEAECREINRIFIKYVTTGKPYVLLKMAATLDGKTVLHEGSEGRRWISSIESRTETHRIRSEMTAVMCGIGTVLADDPELTVRHVIGRDPVIIIVDGYFRIPAASKIVQGAHRRRTIVAGLLPAAGPDGNASRKRIAALKNADVEILGVAPERTQTAAQSPAKPHAAKSRINLADLAEKLGSLGIDSILLEGGSTLAASAVESGIVDSVLFHIAPMLSGGNRLQNITVRNSGIDIAVEGNLAGGTEGFACSRE
jgi:diaminohydroxyphosphoribosylaminopyrimidine deaminase/5-amino-6-(5-phosphoribosylamino)uracil reductase